MRVLLLAASLAALASPALAQQPPAETASAVFLHPDGMGANTWAALRLLNEGPDGRLAWDALPEVAVYSGPMVDQVSASSNGGATSHAWGVRAESGSFGTVGGARIAATSAGIDAPLMIEAKRRGKAIGIVNTASVTDAGTGVQLAVVSSRRDHQAIAAQMLASGADVILGGGEQWFLPKGKRGVHGPGMREDGRDLLREARRNGYTIVRTADELAALPTGSGKVLGLFAAENTFNEGTEEQLAAAGAPVFQPQAPRFDVMVAAALKLLGDAPQGFYLVAEEEATDNLGGDNHAAGVLEAAAGADRAIALVRAAIAKRRDLTLVVASDSDCGGMVATGDDVVADQPIPPAENGAPADGVSGANSAPFLAAPDRAGRRLPFRVSWADAGDLAGGLVARGEGPGAATLQGTIDSTQIYAILRGALFPMP